MLRKVIWSIEAIDDYSSNIDYLIEDWSEREAMEFIENAEAVIRIIRVKPEAFPVSDYKGVRKALICKQINLLYKFSKTEVILLRFWNNRQKPKKRL